MGGRLSFSVVGDSTQNSKAITVNRSNGTDRIILLHQKRVLSDSVLGAFLANFILNLDSNFWFLLTGCCSDISSDDDSVLSGKITIFSNYESQWRKYETEFYTERRKKLEEETLGSLSLLENEIKIVQESAETYKLVDFDFKIDRNGIFKLANARLGSQNLDGPEIEELARQAYFFAKDVVHTHQHHHPKSDSMIDLYSDNGIDEWPLDICRVLYRRILAFKRIKVLNTYDCALGLLTYVESFVRICKKRKILEDCGCNIENIMLQHDLIKESVGLKKDQVMHQRQQKQLLRQSITTTSLVLFGLLISVTGLGRFVSGDIVISRESHFAKIIVIILESPLVSIAALLMLSVLIIHLNYNSNRWKNLAIRIYKVLLTQKKYLATSIAAISALLMGYLSLVFFIRFVVASSL